MKICFTLSLLLVIFLSNAQISFDQTVKTIQDKVSCCSVPFSASSKRKVENILIEKNGNITLYYSDKKPKETFNIFELYEEEKNDTGIDTILGGKFVQFYINPEKIRLIRFATPSDAGEVYEAFLHLFNLIKKPANSNAVQSVYFISRNAIITSNNETLVGSLRSIDKKDIGDSTISISSKGEGWLDKDSLPTGRWNFYAIDKSGKEYLLKSGIYKRTNPEMFHVVNIDSTELKDRYHLSYSTLQESHVNDLQFIKENNWNYYHENGKLWKTVTYKTNQIPIITGISISDVDKGTGHLSIMLKENIDEWIGAPVKEMNASGNLFKKLEYNSEGDVYRKTLYDSLGNIIKTESSKPQENPVSATNY